MKTTDLLGQIARAFPLATVLLLGCVTAHAATCEDIRARIEANLKAAGVEKYSLIVVDTAATSAGKVVGTCDLGTKKLLYAKDPAPKAPAKAASSAILTECRDGSASVGGDCGR
jgi:Protein of unknown function (DUF1161)